MGCGGRATTPAGSVRAAPEEGRHVVVPGGLLVRGLRRRTLRAAPRHGRLLPSPLPGRHVELVFGEQSEALHRTALAGPRRPRLARAGPGLLARLHVLAEARRDHRDAHLVAHRLVDDGAEDDVGLLVRLLLDE